MSKTLTEIAQQLMVANKKVQLIYAFNSVGKTRLSWEFKKIIEPKLNEDEEAEDRRPKVLYYNAFTQDLFYWDNDLEGDVEKKLKIQHNAYTKWVLQEQGQDQNAITHFQRYASDKLTPHFNPDFSEVTFSFERGNEERTQHIKISKGEESNFIWSIFYSLIEQVVYILNVAEPGMRETNLYDQLKYIFIDDPVSSLDENHIIELAVDMAQLIKSSTSEVEFIITTHNPLFYNVLSNEMNTNKMRDKTKKYLLKINDAGTYMLDTQETDSPFSYHLYLKSELEKAIQTGQMRKYHFNFLRNILEKTATFLGYKHWSELLPKNNDDRPNPYEARIINLSSHSKHAGEEVAEMTDDEKNVLAYLVGNINESIAFKRPKDIEKK